MSTQIPKPQGTLESPTRSETVIASDRSFVHKFGAQAALDNSQRTIWSQLSLYSWSTLSTPRILSLTSTLGGDESHQIEVVGLDASWKEQSEVVTLNAVDATLNAETTVNTFLRVFRMRDLTGSNTGAVQAKFGATVLAEIPVGKAQSQMGIYTVPVTLADGSTVIEAYLRHIDYESGTGKDVSFELYIRDNGNSYPFQLKDQSLNNEGAVEHKFSLDGERASGLALNPKDDIDIRGQVATGTSGASVRFIIELVV